MSSNATAAGTSASPIIPVAIGIARSASHSPARSGSLTARRNSSNTQYFHVVFTVPEEIAAIAFQNKRVVYDILFRAAAEKLEPSLLTRPIWAPRSAS